MVLFFWRRRLCTVEHLLSLARKIFSSEERIRETRKKEKREKEISNRKKEKERERKRNEKRKKERGKF